MTALADLEFDEEAHEYRYGGRVVPSVTQILNTLEPVDRTPAVIAAGERGTLVHDACEYLDDGTLVDSGVSDEIRGYLDAYRRFRRECPFETIRVEVKVFSPRHFYAGRVDRVVAMGGKLTILDLKSGAERRTHPLQIAAYREAYKETALVKVQQAACVYLRPDGTYSLKWQTKPSDLSDFLAALRCHNWRNQ